MLKQEKTPLLILFLINNEHAYYIYVCMINNIFIMERDFMAYFCFSLRNNLSFLNNGIYFIISHHNYLPTLERGMSERSQSDGRWVKNKCLAQSC